METYGLALALSLTDDMTSGVNSAITALNGLISALENVDDTASSTSLTNLCNAAVLLGDTFESAGNSILNVFSSVLGNVMSTGSTFENFRTTVGALYGDLDEFGKAGEVTAGVLQNMFDFAVESPFDMTDTMPFITKFKVLGLDAFQQVSGAITGADQSLLQWVTDLMSVRSDMDAGWWSKALTNFLNPDNSRSLYMLKNALGDVEGLLESVGDTLADTAEGRVQNLVSLVEALGATGLTDAMMGHWSTLLSNMEDVLMQFWLGISDAGAFDGVKNALITVVDALNDTDFESFGQSIAGGLRVITVPLQLIADAAAKVIRVMTNFISVHPILTKVAVGAVGLLGILLVLSGVVLKIGGSIGLLVIGFGRLTETFATFRSTQIFNQFTALGARMRWLSVGLTALYVMWNKDFAGIKTKTIAFVNNVKSSFSQARSIVQMNANEMKAALAALDVNNPFDNFTRGLTRLGVLISAVKEGLANQDGADFFLSMDTYEKLAELGLLNIVGRIFDVKYAIDRFVQGFKTGWSTISQLVSDFIDKFKISIKGTFLDDLITKVEELCDFQFDREGVFGFIEKVGEWAGKIAPLVVGLVALRTAFGGLGTVLSGLGGLISGGGILSTLGGGLLSGLGGLSSSISGGLGTAFTVGIRALNPISWLSLLLTPITTMFARLTRPFAAGGIRVVNALGRAITGSRWIQGNGIVSSIMQSLSRIGNLGNMGNVFGGISTVITQTVTAPLRGLASVGSGAFRGLVTAVTSPAGAITAGATAIGTGFGQAYENVEGFKEWVNNSLGLTEDLDFSTMFDGFTSGCEGFLENLKSTFQEFISFDWLFDGLNLDIDFGGLTEGMNMWEMFGIDSEDGNFLDNITEMLGNLKDTLLDLWDSVSPILAYLGVLFADFASVVWDALGIVMEIVGVAIKGTIIPVLQFCAAEVMVIVGSIIEIIQGAIKTISGVIDVVVGIVQGIYGIIKGLFTGDWTTAGEAWEKIKEGFSGITEGIGEIFGGVIDFITGTVANFIELGANIIGGIVEGIEGVWDTITETISNFVDHFIQFFKDLFGISSPSTVMSEIGQFLLEGLGEGINNTIEFVLGIVSSVVEGISTVFWSIVDVVSSIGSDVVEFFTSAFQDAYDAVTGIFNVLGEFFSGIWENVKGLFSGELSPLEFFQGIFQEAYDAVTGIFGVLGEFFSGVWQDIVDLFSSIGVTVGEAVQGAVSTAVNAVLSTAVKIINGFISAINLAIGIINKIPGVNISKLNTLETPQMPSSSTSSGSTQVAKSGVSKGATLMAKGGVVDDATLAVVGEAGKEAVMPLERNTGWIGDLAEQINNTGNAQNNKYSRDMVEYLSTMSDYLGIIEDKSQKTSDVVQSDGLPVIIETNTESGDNEYVPTVPVVNNSSGGNNYSTSSYVKNDSYITRTNTNNVAGNTDNSVKFESGSIVIQASGVSESEAENLANMIMQKIKRQQEVSNLTNYKGIGG